jgi:hypothetical protein
MTARTLAVIEDDARRRLEILEEALSRRAALGRDQCLVGWVSLSMPVDVS